MDQVQSEIGWDHKPRWDSIELVLDCIFKYLTVPELKCARLTSKAWSVAGGRLLTRKTLIRLTRIVNLGPRTEKVPVLLGHCSLDSEFWQCDCSLDAVKEYVPIDTYNEHLNSSVFDSGFVPKSVSVVDCTDVWQLPLDHFSLLEELQVVTFRPSDGLNLLQEFDLMFPNLRNLEMLYIYPEVSQRAIADSNRVGRVADKPNIRLESLTICTSADWAFGGSSVFERLRELKILRMSWCGNYPKTGFLKLNNLMQTLRYNFDGDLQSQWIRGAALSSLTDVSLRLDLTPNNIRDVPDVLNGMNLRKLALELFGDSWEVSQFFGKFSSKTGAALTRLHCASALVYMQIWHCRHLIAWLGKNGFFEKSEWVLSFRSTYKLMGCSSLVKTKNQLIQQDTEGLEMRHIFEEIAATHLRTDLYNYSFQRFLFDNGTAKNHIELFSSTDDLFQDKTRTWIHCNALSSHGRISLDDMNSIERLNRVRSYDCNCSDICNRKTKLLCDYPAFLHEAGIYLPHEHTKCGSSTVTRILSFVDPEILNKWLEIMQK